MRPYVVFEIVLAAMVFLCAGSVARGQISVDEAQRRFAERAATRPAATQPVTEVQRLREENLRLRERVMSLQGEIAVLKQALAETKPTATAPSVAASQPGTPTDASGPSAASAALIGRWRGGDTLAGTAYLLQFNEDNTYVQTFLSTRARESGQYHALDDGTIEMWSDKSPADRKHNQYRLNASAIQLTLTPMIIDGAEIKTPRALVMKKAE